MDLKSFSMFSFLYICFDLSDIIFLLRFLYSFLVMSCNHFCLYSGSFGIIRTYCLHVFHSLSTFLPFQFSSMIHNTKLSHLTIL